MRFFVSVWLAKCGIWLGALLPMCYALWWVMTGRAVNPIEWMMRESGWWTLFFLCVTLAISPLRQWTQFSVLIKFRRLFGLFAFFYAFLHAMIYIGFDQFFDVGAIVADIWKRPFITMGALSFVLMLPLALTSTDGWIRRLKRRWGMLHRLVYPCAIAGTVHFWWLVKRDLSEPIGFALVLTGLLGWRMVRWWSKKAAVSR